MKYRVDDNGSLVIYNESGRQIFGFSRNNYWVKIDYDHEGNRIYYENSQGSVVNYMI